MRKYTGMGEELLNKYRLDFCFFSEVNPELFECLFIDQLMAFNEKYTGELQNYIGSNVYEENKSSIYEMLFGSYVRTRLKYELSLQSIKDKNISMNDFIKLLTSSSIDKAKRFSFAKFREGRDENFAKVVNIRLNNRSMDKEFDSKEVGKLLSNMAVDKNSLTFDKFDRLSSDKKRAYFRSKKQQAFLRMEEKRIRNQIQQES